jgi:hypothetical protein
MSMEIILLLKVIIVQIPITIRVTKFCTRRRVLNPFLVLRTANFIWKIFISESD